MNKGQKIQVLDYQKSTQYAVVYGYILPSRGDTLSLYDANTKVFHHYKVMEITHSAVLGTDQLTSTIYVKHIANE